MRGGLVHSLAYDRPPSGGPLNLEQLFAQFPRLEVLARNVYWRFPAARGLSSRSRPNAAPPAQSISLDDVFAAVRLLGVGPSDVILVHSSMKELGATGASAAQIVDRLLGDLVPQGTLVCPAFPLYANEPDPADRLKQDISGMEFVYDIQKTRTWTGDVGKALMKRPGARRSVFPLNTLAACGPHTDRIFADDAIERIDMPCGPNSPWPKLVALNAKILMVGVDIAHSLTMIHVAEDCFAAEWPVPGWYRQRNFRIHQNGVESRVSIHERKPKWALSYAERRLNRDLIRYGVAKLAQVGDLRIARLESAALLDFLNARKRSAYPYFMPWLTAL